MNTQTDTQTEGYVRNCTVIVRGAEDRLFHASPERVVAYLDGYTILPNENHEKLERNQAALIAALESVLPDLANGTCSRWKGAGSDSLRATLAQVRT